tara:strand:+ start:216 stop:413 length:198 start_codon:yes stop_codon:yes gene_type:complete
MNNWKTDFKVKFHLEYLHKDGTKEMKNNSLIVHAKDEDEARKMILIQYEDSNFLKFDEVVKLWKY